MTSLGACLRNDTVEETRKTRDATAKVANGCQKLNLSAVTLFRARRTGPALLKKKPVVRAIQ